jgi:hypothetical protein
MQLAQDIFLVFMKKLHLMLLLKLCIIIDIRIACKRLFIIVGAPGTLALLRSKGFHTFPDIIDEGYDSILDPIKRWCYLENTIKDFVLKPIDEIKEIVKSKSSILEENFLTLTHLQSQELKNLNV